MSELRFSRLARDDLISIESYLHDRAGELLADRTIKHILARCRRLAQRPQLGRARPDIWIDARSLLVSPWLVLYRVQDSGIEISRIVHQARDLANLKPPSR